MAASEPPVLSFPPILAHRHADAPAAWDLDKCIHCGLCINNCPTYRVNGLEMDSPRGRIYQMVRVATGELPLGPSYVKHLDLCLGCRGCESVCPSGVPYGRMIEAARAEIEARIERPFFERLLRWFVFRHLLSSRFLIGCGGALLHLYEVTGLRKLLHATGVLKWFGKLGAIESLSPPPETPFFFRNIGHVFPPAGTRRYRVALLAGCIQNIFFARLNEASVRVLRKNGCEVHIPRAQGCCGALQAHAGEREEARRLARINIDAILNAGPFDAVISNTAGCGATLKEYHELLEHDPAYRDKALAFVTQMRDINEFLASIDLNRDMRPLDLVVTYQDSCHLAHGQKIRLAPRQLLRQIPGVELREMQLADLCCGSAGIYNVVHDRMAAEIIASKMPHANSTEATVICTANPGCMIQLRAGVQRHGRKQRVAHVVELLDEAYSEPRP